MTRLPPARRGRGTHRAGSGPRFGSRQLEKRPIHVVRVVQVLLLQVRERAHGPAMHRPDVPGATRGIPDPLRRQPAERVGVIVHRQAKLLEVIGALDPTSRLRAACTAGSKKAIRTAMIAITTSSSISVKPRGFEEGSSESRGMEIPSGRSCGPMGLGSFIAETEIQSQQSCDLRTLPKRMSKTVLNWTTRLGPIKVWCVGLSLI